MISAIAGFAAGSIHVLAGPDHLAAISPLAVEGKKSTWIIGMRWGLGHTAGVGLVGLLAVLGRELIPIDLISSYSERLVGLVLITIGIWGIHKALSKTIHTHHHAHDGAEHVHVHTHAISGHDSEKAHRHSHAAFVVGIIHGFAGSSHFLGILPALALPTRMDAAIYLAAFGAGTICAMMAFASAMGIIAVRLAQHGIQFYQRLLIGFSTASIVIGGVWFFI
ncbi:High-affinity nickel transporter [bacterium]|nr:MAG: High-affinity nickel transporter [bacterium]